MRGVRARELTGETGRDVLRDRARLEDLAGSGLLDSHAEESFDRITRVLSRTLDAPVALVSLVAVDRQFFKSQVGLPDPWARDRGTPIAYSFCQHVVREDALLVVEDSRTDPRVKDNPSVEALGVVAYAGAPVHGLRGEPIGSVCAIAHEPRSWAEQELALLQDMADVTSDLVAMRSTAFGTRAAVLALSHDLRTRLSALVLEAEELPASEGAPIRHGLEALGDVVSTALSAVEDLRQGTARDTDLAGAVRAAADRARTRAEALGRRLEVRAPGGNVVVAAPSELAAVLDQVLHALLEHGQGPVTLSVLPAGHLVRVRVEDESDGLPQAVLQRLLARSDAERSMSETASPSAAERAARWLSGRLVVASTTPTALDLLLPAG